MKNHREIVLFGEAVRSLRVNACLAPHELGRTIEKTGEWVMEVESEGKTLTLHAMHEVVESLKWALGMTRAEIAWLGECAVYSIEQTELRPADKGIVQQRIRSNSSLAPSNIVDKLAFSRFLDAELAKRGLVIRELGQETGIKLTELVDYSTGETYPKAVARNRILRRFGYSPEELPDLLAKYPPGSLAS